MKYFLVIAASLGCIIYSISMGAAATRWEAVDVQVWPRNLVRAMQSRLLEEGYDPGPIDGVEGPRTSAALARFEAENGLSPDGKIDHEVLNKLGLTSR